MLVCGTALFVHPILCPTEVLRITAWQTLVSTSCLAKFNSWVHGLCQYWEPAWIVNQSAYMHAMQWLQSTCVWCNKPAQRWDTGLQCLMLQISGQVLRKSVTVTSVVSEGSLHSSNCTAGALLSEQTICCNREWHHDWELKESVNCLCMEACLSRTPPAERLSWQALTHFQQLFDIRLLEIDANVKHDGLPADIGSWVDWISDTRSQGYTDWHYLMTSPGLFKKPRRGTGQEFVWMMITMHQWFQHVPTLAM